jgi:site-specific recombinase XerD
MPSAAGKWPPYGSKTSTGREREVIAVARPKQRPAQEYPLVPTVGEALLRYLQQVRPRCGRRELFLSLQAPFRPLSAGAFYHLVSSRLYQLNIPSLRHGPHALRHACAGHLLAQGFSLKAIGDSPRPPQRLRHAHLCQGGFGGPARRGRL